jgi:hypothetical protein
MTDTPTAAEALAAWNEVKRLGGGVPTYLRVHAAVFERFLESAAAEKVIREGWLLVTSKKGLLDNVIYETREVADASPFRLKSDRIARVRIVEIPE